jgi:hypothetical protein
VIRFGYKLMSEEHAPADLVRNAQRAEELGFDFVSISADQDAFFGFWESELQPRLWELR